MNITYKTVEQPSRGEYNEKNSKFLSYAFAVFSEEEIETSLKQVQKEHPKARHLCYAYRLGLENLYFRANDAGEQCKNHLTKNQELLFDRI